MTSRNLATELLARASLRLAWGDADPRTRGTVLDPADMVGWQVHYFPAVGEDERSDLPRANSATCAVLDMPEVGYACVGTMRGARLGDGDALHVVQALLGLRDPWPEWMRAVSHEGVPAGAEFLLVDEAPSCQRHGNEDHRAAWVCRIWLESEQGRAVDLERVDWAVIEQIRAELEVRIAEDERHALETRAEMRERARVWREGECARRVAERAAANRPNDFDGAQRNSSTCPGMLSQSGAMVDLDNGVAAPTSLGDAHNDASRSAATER